MPTQFIPHILLHTCMVLTFLKATPRLTPLRKNEISPRSRSMQLPMMSPEDQASPYTYLKGCGQETGWGEFWMRYRLLNVEVAREDT